MSFAVPADPSCIPGKAAGPDPVSQSREGAGAVAGAEISRPGERAAAESVPRTGREQRVLDLRSGRHRGLRRRGSLQGLPAPATGDGAGHRRGQLPHQAGHARHAIGGSLPRPRVEPAGGDPV